MTPRDKRRLNKALSVADGLGTSGDRVVFVPSKFRHLPLVWSWACRVYPPLELSTAMERMAKVTLTYVVRIQ